MGSAHGLATVSSQDTAVPATPSASPDSLQVAPLVSLSGWDAAVALDSRPRTARRIPTVSATPTAVPPLALGAYHRAATVLAEAAPACELDWSLLAAVGHVESGHGERAGARLDADGVSHPAIVGPATDAVRGGPLPDTDGGELDGRTDQDRAVGPMQLLPGVWTTAAVDGDGDGVRDPQDIDDAALAAGVLLCTSAPEVSSPSGQRQALRHYNATPGYVDLVRRLATAYALAAAVPTAVDVTKGEQRRGPGVDAHEEQLVSPATVTPSERADETAPAPQPSRPVAVRSHSATTEPDREPIASSPAPTPTAEAPSPEEAPEPDSAPEPSEEPTQEPPAQTPSELPVSEFATVTGVWSTNDGGQFLLDDTVVDPQALGDLAATAPSDLDGDGAAETLGEELEGLTGSTLEITGTAPEPGVLAPMSFDDLRRLTE